MLNSSSGSKLVNQSKDSNLNKSTSSLNQTETGGYESLWEVSQRGYLAPLDGAAEDTAEVDAADDILDDQRDLYENTCINLNNFTLNVGECKCLILITVRDVYFQCVQRSKYL